MIVSKMKSDGNNAVSVQYGNDKIIIITIVFIEFHKYQMKFDVVKNHETCFTYIHVDTGTDICR